MRVRYDPEADVLVLSFVEDEGRPLDHGQDIAPGMILHFDRDGVAVDLEILNASERVADPAAVRLEVKRHASQPAKS